MKKIKDFRSMVFQSQHEKKRLGILKTESLNHMGGHEERESSSTSDHTVLFL
jgi:hypothetical protein